jgi:hypothetical protein
MQEITQTVSAGCELPRIYPDMFTWYMALAEGMFICIVWHP